MSIGQSILLLLINAYRRGVSPVLHALFGPLVGCRFTPTCSAYALEAVRRHGALRGLKLAIGRVCRCHPWGGCGPDPVPHCIAAPRHLARPDSNT